MMTQNNTKKDFLLKNSNIFKQTHINLNNSIEDGDKTSSSATTSAAVNNNGETTVLMVFQHFLSQCHNLTAGLRDVVVWPCGEPIMYDLSFIFIILVISKKKRFYILRHWVNRQILFVWIKSQLRGNQFFSICGIMLSLPYEIYLKWSHCNHHVFLQIRSQQLYHHKHIALQWKVMASTEHTSPKMVIWEKSLTL